LPCSGGVAAVVRLTSEVLYRLSYGGFAVISMS
jgi:hypothetical protein